MTSGRRPDGPATVSIAPVRTTGELALAIALFQDYAASLDVDLRLQGFDVELASMPGDYAPPRGELLLVQGPDGAGLGCIGLRPLSAGVCEIKRLYVRPQARGSDHGKALIGAIIATAQALGYDQAVLDTLPSMTAAIRLYRSLGFEPIPPYRVGAFPELMYFGRALRDPPSPSSVQGRH